MLERILGDRPADELDILALSPEIRELLDREVSPNWGSRRKLKRLREILYSEDELNIHYDASNTLTATETFRVGSGNCLSMTSLFIASARYVGVDAKFQTVAVDPTWDHSGSTMIRYEHIVATGKVSGGGIYVVDFLPEFVIGDMRTNIISDEEAKALYYNNLGAEGVIDGRIQDALDNLRLALWLRPDFSDAWNNMGAAMRRHGDYDATEFSYLRAMHQDYNNYSALSNLTQFYRYLGRNQEAKQFARRVERYRDQNPYFNYYLAQVNFDRGDHATAERYLQRSIYLKRDEPDFYLAMARLHEVRGNNQKQALMLTLAEQYRSGELRAPERRMNHRYWTMTIEVNP